MPAQQSSKPGGAQKSPQRRSWPFGARGVPADCDDLDVAAWFAIREQTDGELPRQDLETWVLEQRARRTRDVLGPEPMTEAELAQLHADLAGYARARNAESETPPQPPIAPCFAGRLPR